MDDFSRLTAKSLHQYQSLHQYILANILYIYPTYIIVLSPQHTHAHKHIKQLLV